MTRKLVITDITSAMATATAMFSRIKQDFPAINCQESIISKDKNLPENHNLEVVFRPGSPHSVIMREVSNAYRDDVPTELLSYENEVNGRLKSTVFYIEEWIKEQIDKQEQTVDNYQVF